MTNQEPSSGPVPPSKPGPPEWFRNGIFVSLIASAIFTFFFLPVANVVSKIVLSVAQILSQNLVDSVYDQAVLGVTMPVLIFLLFTEAGIGLGICAAIATINGMTLFNVDVAKLFVNRARRARHKFRIIIDLIMAITLAMAILYIASGMFVSMQVAATYQRRLNALLPAISISEERDIVGEWALVRTKAGYEIPMSRMDTVAKQRHRALPPRLI